MRIRDILESHNSSYEALFEPLQSKCSNFFAESGGLPVYRNLPTTYDNIHRVKVRFRSKKELFSEVLDQAFKSHKPNLSQRAIFASSNIDHLLNEGEPSQEPFYIFPIDGYRFMYCSQVVNSNEAYKQAFTKIFEQFKGDVEETKEIITQLLQYTYTTDQLHEGIKEGAEIIFYNISHYYAVRTSFIEYNDLLSLID